MFERYTEGARRAIFFARYEACQYGSNSIETEHLLLGLMREDRQLARFLSEKRATAESIRKEIESQIKIGPRISTSVEMPLATECKRALSLAVEYADRRNHRHVGTEHLLAALLSEKDCLAARVLEHHGIGLAQLEQTMTPEGQPQEKLDEDAVRDVVGAYAKLSASGDLANLRRLFLEDASLITVDGIKFDGLEAILQNRGLFVDPHKGERHLIFSVKDVFFLHPEVAVVSAEMELSRQSRIEHAVVTFMLVNSAGEWLIVSAQATPVSE